MMDKLKSLGSKFLTDIKNVGCRARDFFKTKEGKQLLIHILQLIIILSKALTGM